MITITASTVHGAPGATLADMDRETVQCAVRLGGGTMSPERAAEWLREIYADVIRTAEAVTLDSGAVSCGVQVAA